MGGVHRDAANDGPCEPAQNRGLLNLWHVLGLALVCRLGGLVAFGHVNFSDARDYRDMGRELIAQGQTDEVKYMPLYPLWTQVMGEGLTQQLADIALSLAVVWLLYELALALFRDRRAALIAAAIAAVFPHMVFYAVVGLTEIPFVMLLLAAFLLLYRERYFAGIVLLVLTIFVRPTIDPLAPVLVLLFALVVHRRPVGFALGRLAIYIAIYVVLMVPWWVHNYQAYGSFVRLNLGDGLAVYSGNNPRNQSGGGIRGQDYELGDLDLEGLGPVARNEALKDAAYDFMVGNPGRYAELVLIRTLRFWRPWPYTEKFQGLATIAVSLLSFGSVLVLSIWFLIGHARGRWRELTPILAFIIYLTLVHVLTVASIRYRFPIEPFLILFSGAVLASWSRRFPVLDRVSETWLGGGEAAR